MERLFSLCTRYRDILDSREEVRGHPHGLRELILDVSTEELLSAKMAFTYADLYAMLGNRTTVAWLTSHATVMRAGGVSSVFCFTEFFVQDCRFTCDVDFQVITAVASSSEELLQVCGYVFRLLAVSVVRSVTLSYWINASSLPYLMEQCQSLKTLTLKELALDENHLRVLGAYSRPDLEIMLTNCTITSAGTSALANILGRNQGPTRLDCCDIDYSVLANGLRGNSRLKLFRALISNDRDSRSRVRSQALAIPGALRENKGLINLELRTGPLTISDEMWDAVCDSLKTHPALVVLNLNSDAPVASAVVKPRIQALVDMLKLNTSIHTIRLQSVYSEHELFIRLVKPYLETNRLRPRVRAIQKTRPLVLRAKVLGRALLAVRTSTNCLWMLLSGNPDVAFPLTTATTTPAANLPTPTPAADADATSNAAAAASPPIDQSGNDSVVYLYSKTQAQDSVSSTSQTSVATASQMYARNKKRSVQDLLASQQVMVATASQMYSQNKKRSVQALLASQQVMQASLHQITARLSQSTSPLHPGHPEYTSQKVMIASLHQITARLECQRRQGWDLPADP